MLSVSELLMYFSEFVLRFVHGPLATLCGDDAGTIATTGLGGGVDSALPAETCRRGAVSG